MKGIVGIYSSSLRICRNEMYESLGPLSSNDLDFLSEKIVKHEDTYWYNSEETSFVESIIPSNH